MNVGYARVSTSSQNLAKFLEDKNFNLKVIQQNINATTPAGRLLLLNVPQFNSIWNILPVAKICSKNKRL
jgi:DNA invertase Pin-like site-specific DNA recombinase